MQKIIFHDNCLSERGTSTAVYDYAYHSRELLGLDPVICFDTKYQSNSKTVEKFQKEFEVYPYTEFLQVQQLSDSINADYFYAIKYGVQDGIFVQGTNNLIHSVFARDTLDIHGDRYAVVSEWQSFQSGGKIPYVPHMIKLPEVGDDLRQHLGIPDDAVVVGRYGAYDTFNIEFVIDTILKILNKRRDIWFVFMNTEKRIQHERCIYLDAVVDPIEKVKFINTCDAMLHARDYGETFGLSVLEFAAYNKQIISYDNVDLQSSHPLGGRNHFMFLKDQCFKYRSENELGHVLMYLNKHNPFDTAYLKNEFSPEQVMTKFKKVFLE
jgi:glycosyltransferase involved in cell wall biosynthesis